MIDRDVVSKLYLEGKTFREIASCFEVSHQRIAQIVNDLNIYREKIPKGYYFDKSRNRYIARAFFGKSKTLGYFETESEAKNAYLSYRYKYLKDNNLECSRNKINTKPFPTESEIWIAKKLKRMGHKITFTKHLEPFDFIVNDSIKVEVKHRVRFQKINQMYDTASIRVCKSKFDVLIVILGELKSRPTIYVLPSDVCKKNSTYMKNYVYKSKKKKYINNWSIFDKVNSHTLTRT